MYNKSIMGSRVWVGTCTIWYYLVKDFLSAGEGVKGVKDMLFGKGYVIW